jgi:glycosyltransferase involved in cell wall biosynthesis
MVRELDLGGSERQLTEVAKSLDRTRFEPHVGCFRLDGLRASELAEAGVPVAHFPVRSFRHPSVLSVARQLVKYIKQHRIQLVHTFDVPTTIFAVPAGRFTNAVMVASQRAHRDLTSGVMRRLLRATDSIAAGIVVNCEAVKRHLIEDERVPADVIHLCYNGVDVARFGSVRGRRPAALASAANTVGIVCALRPEKSLHTLLEAFAIAQRTHVDTKLAIVGSGPCSSTLQAHAVALEIDAKCVFEPATARVAEWLQALDIFVLPSRSEALSNSLMEAMSCGCAVIASRVGGNVELVQDGRTGLLFDSGDVHQLSAALDRLLGDRTLRANLGAAAARSMRENFSLSASARRMEQSYSDLISHSAGARL